MSLLLLASILVDGCRSGPDEAAPATVTDSLDVEALPPQPGEDRWGFTEDLKAPMWTRHAWSENAVLPGHADLSGGVRLDLNFPDAQERLETAYEDLRTFLATGGVSTDNGAYTIETGILPDLPSEGFRLEVGPRVGRLLASDTEGIRRGVFYLEDEMLRLRGPFLPFGVTERTPLIQRRISRCFFGPIKRPPKMRDELMDDVDYYPEQYLNRLAHEGVNGLWLTIEFRDLAATPFTPEAGQDAERRLAKLRRTAEKCLRYGIRTYIFCIEPRAWEADSPVPERYPDLAGARMSDGKHYFCPSTKAAQEYLYQSVNSIFRAVPDLGGLINISHGERATSCLSALSAVGDGRIDCPRCASKPPWAILYDSLSAMKRGMQDAAPQAELISWLYMPQARGSTRADLADWVYEIPAHTPQGVILQFNFESGVRRTEFGKELVGGDYWISTPGPSPRFERVAEIARRKRTPVSAKIQTGSSHEVATVPYVPVPSLLYRKFSAMRRLGVSHTMLCWYFGNYPGLMNKAAGELSFEPFPKDEEAFLHRLASIQWGREDAPAVVKAWKHFGEGYESYPLTNLFQYYGPMHDGPVWPLLLEPRDAPLAPTWLLGSTLTRKPWPPSGDRIGESMLEAFTLQEATELARRMHVSWDRGVEILRELTPRFGDQPERLLDIGVAEALGIQFRTGHNILRFYQQREEMLRMEGMERLEVLNQLSGIIREELGLNEALLRLCERDSRLGFHSEAEGYKYFPEKIRWRMNQLKNVLAVEVPALERMIRQDKPLFPEYTGRQPSGSVVSCVPSDGSFWSAAKLEPPPGLKWQSCAEGSDESGVRWGASYDAEALYVVVTGSADGRSSDPPIASVLFKLEPRRLWPCKHFVFIPGGEPRAELPDKVTPQTVEGRIVRDGESWSVVMRIPFGRTGFDVERLAPVRVDLRVQTATGGVRAWRPQNPLTPRLALGTDNPADLGWLLFEPRENR